jgi:hypothetical protein
MRRNLLNWVNSQTIGGVSEIAVMAPVKKGRIHDERRTYEERLRFTIANLAGRVKQGIPTELDRVPSIHFGRMIIIRPEQYLVYSAVNGVSYERRMRRASTLPIPNLQIPISIDDYHEIRPRRGMAGGAAIRQKPMFRSWLLTLVEFDGDLRTYFRDIAQFLGSDFDSVFRNCEDFPGTQKFEQFWAWIRRYQIETSLFYPRYRDLSVVRIKQLQDFKRRFDAFVATVRTPTGRRVESMDELFDEFLRKTQQYASDFPAPGGTFKPGED